MGEEAFAQCLSRRGVKPVGGAWHRQRTTAADPARLSLGCVSVQRQPARGRSSREG